MGVPLLDLGRQYSKIESSVRTRLDEVIRRQAFILGESVQSFENAIAEHVGARHAIGVASGTDALLLPLKALDLKRDDEVIAPAFTFFATAGAIHNAGGRPVFVDIEADTFNLSVSAVEAAITPRTRAIVPVHLFGQMADMNALRQLAKKHGLYVLEDAAQAIGAAQRIDGDWHKAGTIGNATAFSFFPSKNLGGFGDGGMITTNDDDLAARLRRLRVHGGLKMYHHEEVGTNSRLDALQAAILHAKLPHLDEWTAGREQNATWYDARLGELAAAGHVVTPVVRDGNRCVYNQYTIRAEQRDALRDHLATKGIGNAVYYPVPLHLQPCFAYLGMQPGSLPVTERAAAEVISIPVFPELSEAELDEVANAITEFYA
jgi:dTDP-4-amino-4,6-dideoxygalactose transaminase